MCRWLHGVLHVDLDKAGTHTKWNDFLPHRRGQITCLCECESCECCMHVKQKNQPAEWCTPRAQRIFRMWSGQFDCSVQHIIDYDELRSCGLWMVCMLLAFHCYPIKRESAPSTDIRAKNSLAMRVFKSDQRGCGIVESRQIAPEPQIHRSRENGESWLIFIEEWKWNCVVVEMMNK